MTARDHFTRYMPPSAQHQPLAYGEVSELTRRRRFNSFWGNFLALTLILFSLAMVVVVIGGGS